MNLNIMEQEISIEDFDKMDALETKFKSIENFQTLSEAIRVKTNITSYYYRERGNSQSLVKIKNRSTYNSKIGLKRIQKNMLKYLFEPIMEKIPNNHMLAYVNGRNYAKTLEQECTGHDWMVTYDIKKYYDNVTKKHIVETLMDYGFTKKGAKMIAHFCVVKRSVATKDGKTITVETLQQGSPCSPALANIVGNKYIDKPVMKWLDDKFKERNVVYKYFRFSDNVGLFLTGEIDKEEIKEYLKFSGKILWEGKFRYHDAIAIKGNHPKVHQKFLGVVLNKVARIDLNKFRKLRGVLFNCVRLGVEKNAVRYLHEEYDIQTRNMERMFLISEEDIIDKFFKIITGKIAYIKQINQDQYNELRNLLGAAKILRKYPELYTDDKLKQDIFEEIKKYNKTSDTDSFSNKIKNKIKKCAEFKPDKELPVTNEYATLPEVCEEEWEISL